MSNEDNLDHDLQVQFEKIAAALRDLKPNRQHQRNQLFSNLYPLIVERLKFNVTQKAILEMLEAHGLKLHPARFKELMAAEAQIHTNTERGPKGEAQ